MKHDYETDFNVNIKWVLYGDKMSFKSMSCDPSATPLTHVTYYIISSMINMINLFLCYINLFQVRLSGPHRRNVDAAGAEGKNGPLYQVRRERERDAVCVLVGSVGSKKREREEGEREVER